MNVRPSAGQKLILKVSKVTKNTFLKLLLEVKANALTPTSVAVVVVVIIINSQNVIYILILTLPPFRKALFEFLNSSNFFN